MGVMKVYNIDKQAVNNTGEALYLLLLLFR